MRLIHRSFDSRYGEIAEIYLRRSKAVSPCLNRHAAISERARVQYAARFDACDTATSHASFHHSETCLLKQQSDGMSVQRRRITRDGFSEKEEEGISMPGWRKFTI